ncbi:MAG: hypothetical protein A2Z18_09950 [Armatimonadetes bacterium RBG_16_58_9]|nr:MAG: hypothetical protein A2Z18_09950 [Armatimonadetes bacterium RBG_16_58_9]
MIRLSRRRLEAFLPQVCEIEEETDFLVFDAASGADAKVTTFMRSADQVLLVATPDPASIVDVYATAKVLFRNRPDAFVQIVVNMVEDEHQAQRVFAAVQSATNKFIGGAVYYGGFVRLDRRAAQLARQRQVFVEVAPDLPASRDIRAIAARLNAISPQSSSETGVKRLRSAFSPVRRKAA